MKESLLIVAFFAAGILCGRFDLAPDFASSDFTSMALLCLLMVCVGISIGSNGRLREILRSLSPRVLLFPLATGLGTYAASAACCLFLGYSVWQCLAVGAGLGYYSLSSVLISQAGFIDIGTIALISNLIREAYAFFTLRRHQHRRLHYHGHDPARHGLRPGIGLGLHQHRARHRSGFHRALRRHFFLFPVLDLAFAP